MYIKNSDDATIICRVLSDKKKRFVFLSKKVNKRDNIVISNGYTEITEEDLAILQDESSTFKFYIEKKKLVVLDNLPLESMSADQLIVALRAENAALKAEKGKGNSTKVAKEMNDLKAENDELKEVIASMDSSEGLAEALLKIAEQETIIEALDTQLQVMSEEATVVNAEEKE
jgi:hypothetical protein